MASELCAYADTNRFVACIDTSTPNRPFYINRDIDILQSFKVKFQPNALLLFYDLLDNQPFPWTEYLTEGSNIGCTIAPYEVKVQSIGGVLDLRQEEARSWLYAEIAKHGIPNVAYCYRPKYIVDRLYVGVERPTNTSTIFLDSPDLLSEVTTFSGYQHWDGIEHFGPENFVGLLPYLLFQARGGSPITEAIGRHIRTSGASGVVFPSSRHETSTVPPLCGYDGWNFVDYTDAPSASTETWVISDPDSWWGLPTEWTVQTFSSQRYWRLSY